ncbi:hypothetical protein [Falsiroseomonas sp.]|uniref:hypothetical protein n=1 Tax=Falsiroseomonas sp. TaxID=2870721 RepID=UPI003F6FD038
MRFWLLSNYEPLPPGPWFSFDTPGAGWGQAPWAPPTWTPETLLADEFGEAVPDHEVAALAEAFQQQAPLWTVIADRPPDLALLAQLPVTLATVQQTLDRLEAAAAALERQGGAIGHNGGPPLVEHDTASIRQAAGEAREAIQDGEAGAGRVSSAIARLWAKAKALGNGIIVAATAIKTISDFWDDVTKAAVVLFHATVEAAIALQGWLTSLLP